MNKSPYHATLILSPAFKAELQAIMDGVRNEPGNMSHRKNAVLIFQKSCEINMDYYFIQPAKDMKLGIISTKALTMGTNTVIKLISSIGLKIIPRLSEDQMCYIAEFVEDNILSNE